MKRRLSHRWLVLCLLAGLSFLFAARAPVAEAHDLFLILPLPSRWIQTVAVTLPNGDAADVYYPRVPFPHAFVDAFPVVAMLQGAQVDKLQYEEFGRRLARHGFVVVIPNHFRSLAPGAPPALFTSRTVITNVLAQMTAEDNNPGSPLYRIVDTDTLALAGHSFGGVVGLFASAAVDVCVGPFVPPFLLPFCDGQYTRPAALRATAFYGTSLVQNGVLLLDLNTTGVATALVQGSLDGRSPLANAELTYPTLEHPRALIEIEGANHYGICDKNNPPGAQPDPSDPTLEQKKAVRLVGKWTALWLRAQLLGDPQAEEQFDEVKDDEVRVRTD
jgi:hypothetical protein